ncbi:MAG: hypothetical protein D6790_21935 [Caldilineae bacterium]|nr:MAG: hypothetical protein D6790_21935 [Caldilineae bacterium]
MSATVELRAAVALPASVGAFVDAAEAAGSAVVGVDPGVTTGMALVVSGQLVALASAPSWAAPMVVAHLATSMRRLVVAVEDAALRQHYGDDEAAVYRALLMGQRVSKQRLHRYRGRAMGAGSVRRDADNVAQAALHGGAYVLRIAPGVARTKVDGKTFAMLTGWQGRSNSHERDAAMVALLPMARIALKQPSSLFGKERQYIIKK